MVRVGYNKNSLDGFIPRQKWFVKKILDSCSGLTLDLGCGRGLWSREMKKRGLDVIGLDLSVRRLKMCKKEGNNDCVVRASCTHLPFKSSRLDSVLAIELIEHLDQGDQDKTLSEIHRILKDGRAVVITTPNKPVYYLLTRFLHFFEYNPEHVHELSLWESKMLMKKYFKIASVDGKLGFLDKIIPNSLCWDILLIGKKDAVSYSAESDLIKGGKKLEGTRA